MWELPEKLWEPNQMWEPNHMWELPEKLWGRLWGLLSWYCLETFGYQIDSAKNGLDGTFCLWHPAIWKERKDFDRCCSCNCLILELLPPYPLSLPPPFSVWDRVPCNSDWFVTSYGVEDDLPAGLQGPPLCSVGSFLILCEGRVLK